MKTITTLIIVFTFAIYAKDPSGLKRYSSIVNKAINEANNTTQKEILKNALKFVKSGKIIQGSCWDYINSIYNESNVTKSKREVVFKSSKKGPYAKANIIQSADWIYHINHSYHNIEHSGMFIAWIDKKNFKALMLSYAGENRKNPARFRVYNIDSTYNIIRAKGAKVQQEYIPLKEYAIKNKISIFNAMKLVKAKKVDYITKEINGKEQIFIKNSTNSVKKEQQKTKEPTIKELMQEIKELKQRVKALEDKLKKQR